MNKKQRIGLAIGGGVIAVGAAVGVGAVAANMSGGTATDTAGYGQGAGGQSSGQQMDTTAMAKALATKLGVDESKVKTALDKALAANQPTSQPSGNASGGPGGGAPSGAAPSGAAPSGAAPSGAAGGNKGGNTEMLTAVAKSMATDLNLDQAKVLAALQEVWTTSGTSTGQASAQPTS
jgi:hypothetical protein